MCFSQRNTCNRVTGPSKADIEKQWCNENPPSISCYGIVVTILKTKLCHRHLVNYSSFFTNLAMHFLLANYVVLKSVQVIVTQTGHSQTKNLVFVVLFAGSKWKKILWETRKAGWVGRVQLWKDRKGGTKAEDTFKCLPKPVSSGWTMQALIFVGLILRIFPKPEVLWLNLQIC